MDWSLPKTRSLWGLNRVADILQTTSSNTFCWRKKCVSYRFHWSYFPKGPIDNYLSLALMIAWCQYTETEMSSFWRNFNHWLHRKLSKWQLSVQSVIKISSKWQHFRFCVSPKYSVVLLWHGQFSPKSSQQTPQSLRARYGVCCDSNIWLTFCHCYRSVVCIIMINAL